MKTRSLPALVLAGILVMPALPSQPGWAAAGGPSAAEQLLSQRSGGGGGGNRGGGRGSGGGSNRRSGGGNRVGGGGGRGGGGGGGGQARRSGNNSGFRTASPGLGRGSMEPRGGWTGNSRGRGTPSLDRAGSADRNRSADRARRDDRNRGGDRNRGSGRNRNRDNDRARRERLDRRDDRWDRAGNRRDDRWDRAADRRDDRWRRASRDWDRWYRYPGWARPGWGPARPWSWGWYGGWSTPRWNWWGPSAAAWGVTTLATAAIINAAVDNAVRSHTTYIVVPNTNYQLLYGTIRPVGTQSTTFSVIANNNEIEITADCDRGTLDGRNPRTRDEAELLNAACQVAFGTA